MIKKKIKIPLYYNTLTIIQTDDFKAIEKEYKLDNIDGEYEGFVFSNGDSIVVVVTSKVTPSIIAHETVHIVNEIFLSTGMQLDKVNDEAQAYLTGFIVEQIHKTVKIK